VRDRCCCCACANGGDVSSKSSSKGRDSHDANMTVKVVFVGWSRSEGGREEEESRMDAGRLLSQRSAFAI